VFIIDDDEGFLKAIARFLRAHDYEVQCYSSSTDFLAQLPTHAAGCVVTDLKMPGMNGLELQLALTESDNPLPIVFLTGHGDIPTSVTAMRSGAEDFLIKTGPKEDLLSAIERALLRDIEERKNRMHQHALSMRFAKLTPREKEVLTHVLHGRLNKQIAADLGIDERSVKRHRTHLMNKLEISSVAELGQLAAKAEISDTFSK
jgi:FixJ family two-component response regulator